VASKPYFLAGSNRKQIVFDRTSTKRLVDKINNPLENIFSTPLIVFSVVRVRDGRTNFYISPPFFTYRQKNQNRTWLIQLRAASDELATVFGRLPIAPTVHSISFHTLSLRRSFGTAIRLSVIKTFTLPCLFLGLCKHTYIF